MGAEAHAQARLPCPGLSAKTLSFRPRCMQLVPVTGLASCVVPATETVQGSLSWMTCLRLVILCGLSCWQRREIPPQQARLIQHASSELDLHSH